MLESEYGHILTADQRIVNIDKLTKLITKRTKLRDPSTICLVNAKSSIINTMDGAGEQLCDKHGIDKVQLLQRKSTSHINFLFYILRHKFLNLKQNFRINDIILILI